VHGDRPVCNGDCVELPSAHRSLRRLGEIDIVRRLQGRYELAVQRSAHLFYLLRGLWARVCLLRNVTVGGPVAVARQANEVRSVCAEIERALETGDAGANA